MRNGEHRVARDYVLYREERKRMRSEKVEAPREEHPEIRIAKEDGQRAVGCRSIENRHR